MAKNVVVCLDGTNNKIRAAANTNVVRMFDLLDLRDPSRQVAYYDPGVGTFSSPAAWTPVARTLSRYAGLAFGAVARRIETDRRYADRLPPDAVFVDEGWATPAAVRIP
jgi:uncharacterized protein (DUF2235 family)